MHIQKNVDLSKHSTMRLGGKAQYFAYLKNKTDIPNAVEWARERKLPIKVIGSGSNIIWGDKGFKGLVLVNQIPGIEFKKLSPDETFLKVGAGEIWDEVVEKSVAKKLHGIEAMSLIPGTTGATPIQNVGAYGQEVSDTLESLEAYDTKTNQFVIIPGNTCEFGYRTSRFKTHDKDRFIISELTFNLSNEKPKPPFYDSLQGYIDYLKIKKFDVKIIRELVIAIRLSKLPDYKKVANNGSFFGNPTVSKKTHDKIKKEYPDLVSYKVSDGYKIPAAWLIQKAGFSNKHDKYTGMATWHSHPLVLVNENAKKTADLIKFRDKILSKVYDKFGISLQQEPELIN